MQKWAGVLLGALWRRSCSRDSSGGIASCLALVSGASCSAGSLSRSLSSSTSSDGGRVESASPASSALGSQLTATRLVDNGLDLRNGVDRFANYSGVPPRDSSRQLHEDRHALAGALWALGQASTCRRLGNALSR